ncbi:hypothetical protein [Curtobacterium sp. MCJR17_043]|uniref:hypothetical protein n=1 Tax=Curtobacterium sp. MCJR17_043 TaxID=2175660 RepID=UPI0024E01956|nr:hypothetical protein [Curtobacterium sp. MCJR17_043]WIB35748.1 hypothetical protein DEJ15_16825 [Curtobacterium sp. MCJR17_043]
MPRADPTRADPATSAWASAAVRHTARVTNTLLAARRFRVVGGDPPGRRRPARIARRARSPTRGRR